MNIYAEEGDKVVAIHLDWGHSSDKDKATAFLTKGATYTIEYTDVHGWHTNVFLKEFPGISFNSVHFEDA